MSANKHLTNAGTIKGLGSCHYRKAERQMEDQVRKGKKKKIFELLKADMSCGRDKTEPLFDLHVALEDGVNRQMRSLDVHQHTDLKSH